MLLKQFACAAYDVVHMCATIAVEQEGGAIMQGRVGKKVEQAVESIQSIPDRGINDVIQSCPGYLWEW